MVITKKNTVNNKTIVYEDNTIATASIIDTSETEKYSIDLDKQLIYPNYEVTLNTNSYDMNKVSEGVYSFNDGIPLKDYDQIYYIISDGVNNYKEECTASNFLEEAVNSSFDLYIPMDMKSGELILDEVCYDNTSLEYDDNITGTLDGTLSLKLTDTKSNKVLVDKTISLKEKQTMQLDNDVVYGHLLHMDVKIVIGDSKYIYSKDQTINKSWGYFSPAHLYYNYSDDE